MATSFSNQMQEALDQYMGEISNDRNNAAKIREEAIANGTWGTKNNSKVVETVATPTETMHAPDLDSTPLLFGIGGFVLGVLVAVLACSIRIKKIKSECETRVSEARASLDRMISMMSKE